MASDADVQAVWAAVLARTNARHEWAPAEFASIDEARAFVAPFRLAHKVA